MYRIFDKIIFERNLIFSIDLHEGSWISCFKAWYYRTLTTSSSQPLFVCVSVNCYCRALNQIGWKAKQAPFSWIYNCTTFIEIFPLFLYIHVHVSTDSTPGKTLLSFYCHISKSKYMECNKYLNVILILYCNLSCVCRSNDNYEPRIIIFLTLRSNEVSQFANVWCKDFG